MAKRENITDVFVIGGGVNGCGIARDAVGRGFSVFLAEMGDLASGTSSAATKLVHGGLRYLEYYEFRLVHEALAEREVLWAMAPHIIWPLRFVLPHHTGLRPAWLLRLGLFVYDHIGARKLLPPTKTLDLRSDPIGRPLKDGYAKAFEYSDCWVDDARLVTLTARDAADKGAVIRTRTRVISAIREGGMWSIKLQDVDTKVRGTVKARLLVNAAGPWVDSVLREALGQSEAHHVRLVKGSHIVVRKLFDHDRAYFFQNADGRIIFAIPYERDFTLIGTTDLDYTGDPRDVRISEEETQYLLAAATEYFEKPVTWQDVVWSYSGVRPLFDDRAGKAQEATRDYVLTLEGDKETGALVNVFGVKLTTHRRLAEEVLERIEGVLGARGKRWTKGSKLPGGEFGPTEFDREVERLNELYPNLTDRLLRRLARQYGTRAVTVLGSAKRLQDLGEAFGADLTAQEVDYLVDQEWARTADDILWRRTKVGLRIGMNDKARLEAYVQSRLTRGKT
ncbi:MAG: glycerol-3-phosphate dehydrogenase [Devosia nanyangense]|uniref:Glycerol-3-phosphate dehydrogenase n=1 Tax=Devosia nanyangense TaxID=1228055 RepID=A0A933NWW0_9HYPH|nr:glycerol-3-phosphate dehydrogenase [Devosia nanyangense]